MLFRLWPGTYICPGIPKKSVGIPWDSKVKSVGFHGIPTEKKNRIPKLDSGIPFPILFWDSKIYAGFQKICRIPQTLRIQTGIFGSISAKIVVNSRGLLHDTF